MVKKTISLFSLVSMFSATLFGQTNNVGVNIEDPNRSATMHIVAFNGKPARITAKIADGKVTGFNLLDGGYGYKQAPNVLIVGGGPSVTRGAVRATATTTIDAEGRITAINLTNGGSGYISEPIVTLVADGSTGWVLPRVDLQDTYNTKSPVDVSADIQGANGLLVFNSGNNNNFQAPYWFDKSTPKWFEMVDANITPRVSVFSFTGNDLVNGLNYQGDYARFIKSPLFKDPISNIPGVELTTSAGYYAVKLPRVAATYTIEVSLNMTTAPTPGKNYAYNATQECVGYGGPASGKQECSKDMNAAGYNMMGYFLEMGVLYASIGYQNADGSNARIRKESPVVDKIGGRHSVSWSTTIKVTPRTDNTADPVVEFMLGRMDRSTYFLPATVIGDGSFIKIQQLK